MISRLEISKDSLQQYAEATATSVGAVTGIVVAAMRDITEEIGSLATELLEISDTNDSRD